MSLSIAKRIWLGGLAIACASLASQASAQRSSNSERAVGVYRFQERIAVGGASPAIMLEGEFTILNDTLLLTATPGPCRYDLRTTGVGRMIYLCADVTLMFDRRDPLRHPEYSVLAVVTQTVRTCSQQRSDGSCSRFTTELVERTVERTGTLKPVKVPAGQP